MIEQKEDVYFNKVFILQSLDSNERRTGDEIELTIKYISFRRDKSIEVELIDLGTKEEFFYSLQEIKSAIREGVLPFIHFEIHGSKDGLVLSNGDAISWLSLKEPLRELNVSTKNNLFISLATCFGAHLLGLYKFSEPCPFYGYIGPLKSADNRELEISYSVFFKTLLLENDFNKAITALLDAAPSNANNYVYLSCFGYFTMLKDMYKEENRNPRIRNARVKEMMRLYRNRYGRQRLSNKKLRRLVEAAISSGAENEEFAKMEEVFFHQRPHYR